MIAKFNFTFKLALRFAYIQIDSFDQTSLKLVIYYRKFLYMIFYYTYKMQDKIDTKALAYIQKYEGKCLAKISPNTYL